MSPLVAGTPAPSFSLRRADQTAFTEADLQGTTTVLVFYPFAFSPVCTDQLSLYDDLRDEFAAQGATLYGVSCDAVWSQSAFREKLGVEIEQLSDFEPKGATCRAFDVYHPGGFPQRALVIVGPDGVVRWSHQADSPGDLPGANLIFDGLQAV
ncbi:MAG TPA: redoxin domain-containing protein [Solirubrobacteraceae bacterium]|nr:redoxin domain-containing protein [Solirubrobacteraceae bacterium]